MSKNSVPLPQVADWPDRERLAYERALLGVYLSSHPLREYERTLRLYRSHAIEDLARLSGRTSVLAAGILTGVRKQTQKRGRNANQLYARFNLQDETGSIGCVLFADGYAEFGNLVEEDAIRFVEADIDTSRDEVGLIINAIVPPEAAPKRYSGSIVLRLRSGRHTVQTVESVYRLLQSRPGEVDVLLEVRTGDGLRVGLKADEKYRVAFDSELLAQLEEILGPGCVGVLARNDRFGNSGLRGSRRYSGATP